MEDDEERRTTFSMEDDEERRKLREEEYRRKLLKNIQMLATLVATATYAAAFNPPGGVWQDIHDATGRHLPGDPIMLYTHYGRYVVFFYCNAAAFAFSLAVVVLTLLVTAKPKKSRLIEKQGSFLVILMSLMLVAMLTLAAAYGAGACRDKLMVVWYCLLVPGPLALFIGRTVILRLRGNGESSMGPAVQSAATKEEQDEEDRRKDFRKLMVPVYMFAVTITYVAGLSTPGGFWDSAEGGHRPGDAILKDRLHGRTLRGFLLSNTLAFVASLYGVSIVVHKKTSAAGFFARLNIFLVLGLLGGLLIAYITASSRGRSSTAWLTEAVWGCIMLYVAAYVIVRKAIKRWCFKKPESTEQGRNTAVAIVSADAKARKRRQPKLVQLMASLAVAITYQAGLYPPGGLWLTNTDDHTAGDPILLTTNSTRYRGFHYSNSVSFVASLLAMLLAQKESLHEHHALEAAMLLDMLGLIGAYAIGSCRDQVSTLYVVGIAGAVVVYVFVHVSYFTLGDADKKKEMEEDELVEVEKLSGRFLFFAILVASMTYQAGLTPPGGFLLKDDTQSGQHAGDPVLRYNYPRRYRAFFYCNSVSFMVSIVIILLLINPIEYRPAIKSHALSVCAVASYVGLMGAFAAGSTQHMKGSITFFVLAAVVTFFLCLVVIPLWLRQRQKDDKPPPPPPQQQQQLSDSGGSDSNFSSDMGAGGNPATTTSTSGISTTSENKEGRTSNKSLYLVTLAILVASATYPAGLDPPGGSWQSSSDGHDAGNPMMLDNRRPRYFAFFLSNTTSFMASIFLIHMLLPAMLRRTKEFHESYRKKVLNGLVYLQCLGFLVAYAAGSSRKWKTSLYTGSALVIFVLTFFFMHILLSRWLQKKKKKQTTQHCLSPCKHCRLQSV